MSMIVKYSQAGQDKFVLSLFNENYKGFFVDVGCNKPDIINNTLALEEKGWIGISIDIEDHSNEWKIRKNPFIQTNALTCNYETLFSAYELPKIIDYLSLDIEGNGDRFSALKKIFESSYEFKIITIEHDAYRGYGETERKKQREFLIEKGYFLLCGNVILDGFEFEDWWINPKYFVKSEYIDYLCTSTPYLEILNKKY
jgi:hypothetical protein